MNSPLWASGGALFVGLLWMGPALSAGFCRLRGMEVLTNIPFGHNQTCPLWGIVHVVWKLTHAVPSCRLGLAL
jgi:hypothetical protein